MRRGLTAASVVQLKEGAPVAAFSDAEELSFN